MLRIFVSPGKYIQGPDALKDISRHTQLLGSKVFVVISKSGLGRFGNIIKQSYADKNVHFEIFNGECSRNEISRLTKICRELGSDVVMGVGGGKICDTSKCIGHAISRPVVIVPTNAASDAPCSSVAVIYSDDGAFEEVSVLPDSPKLVLVDSNIIAAAPIEFLVAGMGDALSTYFEARASAGTNSNNCLGGKPTRAALELANLCYKILLADGYQALLAVEQKVCTPALENVIEANTLLSCIGFESGGLAGAHKINEGLDSFPQCHHLQHGEKVAFGTLAQLVMENAPAAEVEEVLAFCTRVGLPITLEDLGVTKVDSEVLMLVAKHASETNSQIHNMAADTSMNAVFNAIVTADALGRRYRGRSKAL